MPCASYTRRLKVRPNWDQTWAEMAVIVSKRSACIRTQVGAVIVDNTNRIVATGYNGPPSAYRVRSDTCLSYCTRANNGPTPETIYTYTDCPSIHAEANALMFCDRKDRLGGTLYVTFPPCWTCAKNIANSGLARVCMTAFDKDAPPYDWSGAEDFIMQCGIKVQHV